MVARSALETNSVVTVHNSAVLGLDRQMLFERIKPYWQRRQGEEFVAQFSTPLQMSYVRISSGEHLAQREDVMFCRQPE